MQNDRKTVKVHVPEHQKKQLSMFKKVKDIYVKRNKHVIVL